MAPLANPPFPNMAFYMGADSCSIFSTPNLGPRLWAWELIRGWPKFLRLCTHGGNLEESPGSMDSIDLAQAIVAIWGVNQVVDDCLSSL